MICEPINTTSASKVKRCTKCGVTKDLSAFYKNKNCKGGVSTWCKECQSAANKQWRLGNPEKASRHVLEWRVANKDRHLLNNKLWRHRNREKEAFRKRNAYEKDKAYYTEYRKNWSAKNRDKRNFSRSKRRAAMGHASPPWLAARHLVLIAELYTQARDLTEQTGVQHHVDHVHALQGDNFCGLHVPWNLQVLPFDENTAKRNRPPPDEYDLFFHYTQDELNIHYAEA